MMDGMNAYRWFTRHYQAAAVCFGVAALVVLILFARG